MAEAPAQNTTTTGSATAYTFQTTAGAWHLDPDRLKLYIETFPALDVAHELAKARLWLIDNSGNRKTPKGMPRFLSGWLSRAKPNGQTHDRDTCGLDDDPIEPPDWAFLP